MIKQSEKMHRKAGFSMIEIMIVVAIIGILAAIAIPNFMAYRVRAFNTAASADLRNAYTAAQAFFADEPGGTATAAILADYGYAPTENVTFSITNGTRAGLVMTTVHAGGDATYTVNNVGNFTSNAN